MKIEVNISKKVFFMMVISVVLLMGAFWVYAYGTNNPSVFGHSANEMAPPAGCSDNQFLKWDGSSWSCASGMGVGINFITPVIINYSNQTDINLNHKGYGWRTYDASNIVPEGATALVIEVAGSVANDYGGETMPTNFEDGIVTSLRGGDVSILFRKNAISNSFKALMVAAEGGADVVGGFNQGIYPLNSDRTIQYRMGSWGGFGYFGYDRGYYIKIVGYVN